MDEKQRNIQREFICAFVHTAVFSCILLCCIILRKAVKFMVVSINSGFVDTCTANPFAGLFFFLIKILFFTSLLLFVIYWSPLTIETK